MRLLHVVPSYYPAVRYGDPIVSVHALCKALARRGHDVHVFTTNVDGNTESNVPVGVPLKMDDVRGRCFPLPFLRRLYWFLSPGNPHQSTLSAFPLPLAGCY